MHFFLQILKPLIKMFKNEQLNLISMGHIWMASGKIILGLVLFLYILWKAPVGLNCANTFPLLALPQFSTSSASWFICVLLYFCNLLTIFLLLNVFFQLYNESLKISRSPWLLCCSTWKNNSTLTCSSHQQSVL